MKFTEWIKFLPDAGFVLLCLLAGFTGCGLGMGLILIGAGLWP